MTLPPLWTFVNFNKAPSDFGPHSFISLQMHELLIFPKNTELSPEAF